MKLLRDLDASYLAGKKVLVRLDLDVPMEKGIVMSDARLRAAIPTLEYLKNNALQIIIMGHAGRPGGKKDPAFTLEPVREKLEEILHEQVLFAEDCLQELPSPDVARFVLLENLRFYPEEELNDEAFSKKLSAQADIYVNDSFATMHRAHASTAGVMKFIPAALGFQAEKELNFLNIEKLPRPIVAIIGGSKISTKFGLLQALLDKVDYLIIGGAMVFTLYKAQGFEVGKSLYEQSEVVKAGFLVHNEKIVLPDDIVVANDRENPTEVKTAYSEKIPADYIGLDIGPDSIDHFKIYIDKAKSVIWNGPMGYFEKPPFDAATNELARYLAQKTKEKGLVTILGGGDTESAVQKIGLEHAFTHLSTGGGASLELLSGKELPAVKALKENEIEFFS